MLVDLAVRPREVHVCEGRVVRAAGRDHDMVDRRQTLEELRERGGIGGVEGRGAPGAELARGALEAVGVTTGEDDVGALGACAPGRFEADAGAAADDDDGLAEQLGLALGGCDGDRRAGDSLGQDDFTPTCSRAAATAGRSALRAAR